MYSRSCKEELSDISKNGKMQLRTYLTLFNSGQYFKNLEFQENLNLKYKSNQHSKDLNGTIYYLKIEKNNNSLILNRHTAEFDTGSDKDPWIINMSKVKVPDEVSDILRFGEKFNSKFVSNNDEHIFHIIKDLESNTHKLPDDSHLAFMRKILSLACN